MHTNKHTHIHRLTNYIWLLVFKASREEKKRYEKAVLFRFTEREVSRSCLPSWPYPYFRQRMRDVTQEEEEEEEEEES